MWCSGKTGAGSYNTTDQAIVSDLTNLPYTITGLTSGTDYSVRVAAVNSADTTVLADEDGRDRTAEVEATAT